MNGTQKGSVRALVISTLQRFGHLPCAEIERRAKIAEGGSRSILKDLRTENKARIYEWTRHSEKSAPHAVWTLGSEPDAERPALKGRASRAVVVEQGDGEHRDLPMDYPLKTVFAGGVNPWVGRSV